MEENRKDELGQAPVGRLLFRLAVPTITAQLVNVLYNMVDRMYIGHIAEVGATALTGVGVTFSLIMIISAFAALIGMGGAPLAAIHMGKKENAEAEGILGNCFLLLIVTALVLTGALLTFGESLLLCFGASEETLPYALAYMNIYACGTIFVLLTIGMNAFITTQGFAKISMGTVLLGAGCNIVLDPILIFGLGMGVRGAALATICSQAISCVWVLRFLFGTRTLLAVRRRNLRLKPKRVGMILALGISPFIMQSTESLISICFNTSLLKYGGNTAVGCMTILSSVMQFALLPLMGLCSGAQPITGYNFGAGNVTRVRQTYALLLKCCLVYTSVLWLIAMLKPEWFARIFTNDAELIAMTRWALRIYLSSMCLFGAQIACQQTFLALGEAKRSMFLAIFRKIILLIPLIYLMPVLIGAPLTAVFEQNMVAPVFFAEPVADFLAVCMTVTLFRRRFRQIGREMEARNQERGIV